jgi:hypothetical protein
LQSRGALAAENYSSLQQCGSSKRLQLRWQDLKSNDMAASEDGGGAAVAWALGRKTLQQERSIRSVVGRRQKKNAAGARRKHVGRRQVKIAAGARQKLALSSAHASMLLGSKLRGGALVQQYRGHLIPPPMRWMERERSTLQHITSAAMEGGIPPMALEGSLNPKEGEERLVTHLPHSDLFSLSSHCVVWSNINNWDQR